MDPTALLHPEVLRQLHEWRWEELRDIQAKTLIAIRHEDAQAGRERDYIISARTAGGKTEAAFLPLLSDLLDQPRKSLGIVYVGPLRALINDQFRRLELLCQNLSISVHRWHGEVGQAERKAVVDDPSGVLLITPESIESLFLNRTTHLARILHDVAAVVIDELHVFPGRERGVHLRSLLSRVDRLAGRPVRRIGLSATLGDPASVASWLRPSDPGRVHLIRADGEEGRFLTRVHAYYGEVADDDENEDSASDEAPVGNLSASDIPKEQAPLRTETGDPTQAQMYIDIMRHHAQGVNLVFGNSRQVLEHTVHILQEICRIQGYAEDRILIHHGSVSRDVREACEKALLAGGDRLCLCSPTLELGVDIGSVAAVGHLSAPQTVASLAQRLGRSGRRPGEAMILRQYHLCADPVGERAGDLTEEHLSMPMIRGIALVTLYLEGWCEPLPLYGHHWSTVVHQVMSHLAETGGLSALALHQRIAHPDAFHWVGAKDFAGLLRNLARNRVVEQLENGDLLLGEQGEFIVNHYSFYAAFPTSEMYQVRSQGDTIGQLDHSQVQVLTSLGWEGFRLAGRGWLVEEISPERLVVEVRPGRRQRPIPFTSAFDIDLHQRVTDRMWEIITSEAPVGFIDAFAERRLALARDRARTIELKPNLVVSESDGQRWWFAQSSAVLRTIEFLARRAGMYVEREELSLLLPKGVDVDEFRRSVAGRVAELVAEPIRPDDPVRALFMGQKFDSLVPLTYLQADYIERSLDIEGAERALVSSPVLWKCRK